MALNNNFATNFKEIGILSYEPRSCRNRMCVMIIFKMLTVVFLKHYFMDFIEKLPVGGYNPNSSFLVFFFASFLLWYGLRLNITLTK